MLAEKGCWRSPRPAAHGSRVVFSGVAGGGGAPDGDILQVSFASLGG